MKVEPQEEHRWLQKLVGEWIVSSGATGEWVERVRSLDGLWVMAEGHGRMPDGGPAVTMMTLGYDPHRQRYVGTWVGSMMTHLWVYEGTLDDGGKVLTLDCEGPDFEREGRLTRYQDIITVEDDDHRTLTARMLSANGTWKQLMSMRYRRRSWTEEPKT